MRWHSPVMNRLLIPVLLASMGGLLFLSGQWVRAADTPRGQDTRASLEMMQLLHDEHQLIGEMVKQSRTTAHWVPSRLRRPSDRKRSLCVDESRGSGN